MAFGFGREDPDEVFADHESRYADIAAKELVVDGDDSHVVAIDALNERREYLGSHRTGEHANWGGSTRAQRHRRSPGALSIGVGAACSGCPVALGWRSVDP